jgi:hypothetical protein
MVAIPPPTRTRVYAFGRAHCPACRSLGGRSGSVPWWRTWPSPGPLGPLLGRSGPAFTSLTSRRTSACSRSAARRSASTSRVSSQRAWPERRSQRGPLLRNPAVAVEDLAACGLGAGGGSITGPAAAHHGSAGRYVGTSRRPATPAAVARPAIHRVALAAIERHSELLRPGQRHTRGLAATGLGQRQSSTRPDCVVTTSEQHWTGCRAGRVRPCIPRSCETRSAAASAGDAQGLESDVNPTG